MYCKVEVFFEAIRVFYDEYKNFLKVLKEIDDVKKSINVPNVQVRRTIKLENTIEADIFVTSIEEKNESEVIQ